MGAAAPAWLVDWGVAAGAITAVLTLAGLLVRGGRRFVGVVGDELDERIEAHTAPIARRVDQIHHELHPNEGQSLRDVVDRTERRVGALEQLVTGVRENPTTGGT